MKITPRLFPRLIAGLLAVAGVAHAADVEPQDQPVLPQLAAALEAATPSNDTLMALTQGGLALLAASAVRSYGHPTYPYYDSDPGIYGIALSLSMPVVTLTGGQRTGCGVGVGSFFGVHATGVGCAHAWALPGGQTVTARFGGGRSIKSSFGNPFTGLQASVSMAW